MLLTTFLIAFKVQRSESIASSANGSSDCNSVGLSGSVIYITIPAFAVENVLEDAIYHPPADYTGPDVITVRINDLGNTGYGIHCLGLEELNLPCRLTGTIH